MPDESKFEFTKGSWSTSKASFVHHRAIAMTLDEAIAEREAPLPPARNIFPRLISFWNIAKAPTDKKSQILKSIQPNLFKFGTMARVWVRVVLGGAVCNAVRTYRLDCLSSAVRDKKIISLRQFRNRANALGSFSDTLKQQMTVHQWLQFESVQPTTPVAPQTQAPGHTKIFWKGNVELDLTQEAQKLDLDKANQQLAKAKRKRKIDLYTNEDVLRALRQTNVNIKHVPTQFQAGSKRQKYATKDGTKQAKRSTYLKCVLCCMACEGELDHDDEQHKRKKAGFDTTFCCEPCGFVPLCIVPRAMWGGLSCFEVWHDRRVDFLHSGKLELTPCRSAGRTRRGQPFPLAVPVSTPGKITPVMVAGNNRVSEIKRSRTNPERRQTEAYDSKDAASNKKSSDSTKKDGGDLGGDFAVL